MSRLLLALLLAVPLAAAPPAKPTINAQTGILSDPATSSTLFWKSADTRTLQGSTAKLMSAYVAFWAIQQKLVNLDDLVTISTRDSQQPCSCMKASPSAVPFSICGVAAGTANIPQTKAGEVFRLRDLLRAMLNQSTGEATDAVAAHVAAAYLKQTSPNALTPCVTSEALMAIFVGLMNQHAQSLGLKNSLWLTVHGGDNCDFSLGCNPWCTVNSCGAICPFGQACPGVGTTPQDLATIWNATSKLNGEFLRDTGARSFSISSTLMGATIPYSFTHSYAYYPGVDGDKNGSSGGCPNAGCWVSEATRAGRSLIASVLQAGSFNNGWSDLATLYRYGFSYLTAPARVTDSGSNPTEATSDHRLACNTDLCYSAYTAGGILKLIAWSVNLTSPAITRTASYPSGGIAAVQPPVTDFDIAVTSFLTVTAQVSSSNVKLSSYSLKPGFGNTVLFNPLCDTGSTAGAGTAVRLLTLSDNLVVSAVRDTSGYLRMATWNLSALGVFTKINETTLSGPGQTIGELALAGGVAPAPPLVAIGGVAPINYQVVTATTTAGSTIRLYSWSVDSLGALANLSSSSSVDNLEVVRNVSIAYNGGGKFGTSVTKGSAASGTHEIIFWETDSNGSFIRASSSSQGGETAAATAIAPLGPAGYPGNNLFGTLGSATAFVTAFSSSGNVSLVSWDLPKYPFEGAPADIRTGDAGTAAGGGVSVRLVRIPGTDAPHEQYVAQTRTAAGALFLTGWTIGQTIPVPQLSAECKANLAALADSKAELKANQQDLATETDPAIIHMLAQQNLVLQQKIAKLMGLTAGCTPQ